MRVVHFAAVVLTVGLLSGVARAEAIRLNTFDSSYWIYSINPGPKEDRQFGALPDDGSAFQSTRTATSDGVGFTTATVARTSESLSLVLQQERTGAPGVWGAGSASIKFMATEDLYYRIGGWYGVDDGGSAGKVSLSTTLQAVDWAPGTAYQYADVLFRSAQTSTHTADQTLTLGGSSGDTSNALAGSLTGVLKAGRNYAFDVSMRTDAAGSAATAGGRVWLEFSNDAQAVPLPAAAFAGLTLLGGMGVARRRLRHRAAKSIDRR
jgi:hypothetical protein